MAFAWTQSSDRQSVAQVTDRTRKPDGVISKRAQQYVILGIAVAIVLVAMFSTGRQRKPISAAQNGFAPPIHEGNQRKLADYGDELADQGQCGYRDRARLLSCGTLCRNHGLRPRPVVAVHHDVSPAFAQERSARFDDDDLHRHIRTA